MNIKLELPESFYEGEERCGYYVSPEMKKVWAVQLDLIAEFARVCEKHNLTWYADGGTLLGAARHKGFIPWDDDVDLIMMRSEYERLREISAEEFRHPYLLYSYEGGNLYIAHAKLYNEDTTMIDQHTRLLLDLGAKNTDYPQGVHIDLFVADNLPDDERAFRRMYRKASFFQALSHYLYEASEDMYYLSPSKLMRTAKSAIYHALKFTGLYGTELFSHKRYFRKFMEAIKSCDDTESRRVANLALIGNKQLGGERNIWQRKDFLPQIHLPFETLMLPAASGYDNILTCLYGNWREFKITHNHGTFFDTEKSYKYYVADREKGAVRYVL